MDGKKGVDGCVVSHIFASHMHILCGKIICTNVTTTAPRHEIRTEASDGVFHQADADQRARERGGKPQYRLVEEHELRAFIRKDNNESHHPKRQVEAKLEEQWHGYSLHILRRVRVCHIRVVLLKRGMISTVHGTRQVGGCSPGGEDCARKAALDRATNHKWPRKLCRASRPRSIYS